MATLAATQVTGGSLGLPVPVGPLTLEVWRCAGGAAGSEVVLVPKRGRYVIAALSNQAATSDLSTNGTNTNVTFTLTASSTTSVTFDAWLLVSP